MPENTQSIKTYARLKPLPQGQDKCLAKKNICTVVSRNNGEFSFDEVFDENASNQEIYNITTKPIIQQNFKGFNSCVLAYGQTASGKTFTMKGTLENPGIIPLCIQDIFQKIQSKDLDARLSINYFQVYNENIIDLLSNQENCIIQLREDYKKNINLLNITQEEVNNVEEAMTLFQKGQQRRKFASNSVNNMSSRSHVIFRLTLSVIDKIDYSEAISQINLVDLAGSEGINQTNSFGITKKEGETINKSILALNKVIKAMSEAQDNKGAYIGFRDSKLTRILQSSLCANSKSAIICNVSLNGQNYQQSINTLNFGNTAGKIRIKARQNLIQNEVQIQTQREKQVKNSHTLMPSERIELQKLRQEVNRLKKNNQEILAQCSDKQKALFNMQTIKKSLQDQKHFLSIRLQKQTEVRETLQRNFQHEKENYQMKILGYEEQLQKLQSIIKGLERDKKLLESNQRSILGKMHYYQRQVGELEEDVEKMRSKLQDELSRTSKPKLTTAAKKNLTSKTQQNPFSVPPYRPNVEYLSPMKQSIIIKLKTQVVQLNRKIKQYIKANQDLIEQNQELFDQIQKHERQLQEDMHSGKINPINSEINRIRKLQNKIKKLQRELELSRQRERRSRQVLNEQNNQYLEELSQFEEWFNKKYDKNYWQEQEIQTIQEMLSNVKEKIQSSSSKKIKPNSQKNLHHTSKNLLHKSSQRFVLDQSVQQKLQNPEQKQEPFLLNTEVDLDQEKSKKQGIYQKEVKNNSPSRKTYNYNLLSGDSEPKQSHQKNQQKFQSSPRGNQEAFQNFSKAKKKPDCFTYRSVRKLHQGQLQIQQNSAQPSKRGEVEI